MEVGGGVTHSVLTCWTSAQNWRYDCTFEVLGKARSTVLLATHIALLYIVRKPEHGGCKV